MPKSGSLLGDDAKEMLVVDGATSSMFDRWRSYAVIGALFSWFIRALLFALIDALLCVFFITMTLQQ